MKIVSVNKLPIIKNTNTAQYIELLKLEDCLADENEIKLGDCFVTKPDIVFYTIKPNETLETVAKKFNVSVETLKKINQCEKVFFGQRVRVKL